MGCYSLQPIRGAKPIPGAELELYMNDAGRAALVGQIGPEVALIRGRLLDTTNSDYLLSVSGIETFRNGSQAWRGEQVRIKPEYVLSASERRFSAGQTVAFCVVGAAGMAYLVKNVASGLFFPERDVPEPGDTSDLRRVPRNIPVLTPRRVPRTLPSVLPRRW